MFKMNNVMQRLSSYSRNCYHQLKLKQNWKKVYIPHMSQVDSLNERPLQPIYLWWNHISSYSSY